MGVETCEREGAERFNLDVWIDVTVCLTFRSWETTNWLADRMLSESNAAELGATRDVLPRLSCSRCAKYPKWIAVSRRHEKLLIPFGDSESEKTNVSAHHHCG